MSLVNSKLKDLFLSNEFVGHRKIIISSAGTSKRNNLKQHLGPNDVLYAKVLPNPSLDQLIHFFRNIQLTPKDIVFSIGGGSVIDFSKLVALFADTPDDEIKGLIETGQFQCIERALKLVVVPTLFGSGAEQTPFAVCYIGKNKYSVANGLILPARVEYFPELNMSAPTNTKLANVLDCFCQAAESLTAQSANDVSVKLAERTIRLLVPIAKEYIEGNRIELAAKMAEASCLCGRAIAISKTTGPHAMSYFLTKELNWEHGKAVAMVFPYFFENYDRTLKNNPSVQGALNLLFDLIPFNKIEDYFVFLGLDFNNLALELVHSINFEDWLLSVNVERLSNGPILHENWLKKDSIFCFYNRHLLSV